jgi:hypothetical protein
MARKETDMKPKYLVADMGLMGDDYPNLWGSPLYMGLGPQVPGDRFMDGPAQYGWRKLRVLPVGDRQNPFDVPVVMARKLKKGE